MVDLNVFLAADIQDQSKNIKILSGITYSLYYLIRTNL